MFKAFLSVYWAEISFVSFSTASFIAHYFVFLAVGCLEVWVVDFCVIFLL